MIRLLIPLILLVMAYIMARRYLASSNSPEQKKARKITVALVIFAVVMIVLAIFHRMHWVGALIAAIAPVGRILLASVIDHFRKTKAATTDTTSEKNHPKMSEEEALQILGLKKPFTQEALIDAHRKLIQKFHPDRGGNDYLAARINEAKDFLIKTFES